MKKLFVLLVILNMVLFAAQRWGDALLTQETTPSLPAAVNADKIKLLGRVPQPLPASAVAPVSVVAAAAPALLPAPIADVPRTDGNICLEWGEFSGADLARSEQALAALKLGDRLGQRTVEYSSGYWVYVPPQKTRKGVHKKVEQLKERGVTDYFVVQEKGPWLNAISLGVFKTEEAAQKYLNGLKERDVRTAKVGERAIKLKFVVHVLKHLDAQANATISAMLKDYPDSTLKSVNCN